MKSVTEKVALFLCVLLNDTNIINKLTFSKPKINSFWVCKLSTDSVY